MVNKDNYVEESNEIHYNEIDKFLSTELNAVKAEVDRVHIFTVNPRSTSPK